MKKFLILSLITASTLAVSGCFVYERRPTRTVVVEETPVVRETVITTLPRGYRTRIYRGSTYYYSGDVVYRQRPSGGYVVVTRPW
jgi:hypothetical protein